MRWNLISYLQSTAAMTISTLAEMTGTRRTGTAWIALPIDNRTEYAGPAETRDTFKQFLAKMKAG